MAGNQRLTPAGVGRLYYAGADQPWLVRRRLFFAGASVLGVVLVGVAGYWVIGEGRWSILDCLYFVLITVTTVGYAEVLPVQAADGGRLFTMVLLITGMGVSFYFLSALTAFIIEGDLREALWRRRMQRSIDGLTNHYIVCGAGETGRSVVEQLLEENHQVVVVELRTDHLDRLARRVGDRFVAMQGDATEDALLRQCGVERAAGIVATLHSDADNLFVAVTARQLNRGLRIVSRAIDERADRKLLLAGADAVVSPNDIGGRRMAHELLRPHVVGFMDFISGRGERALAVEECRLPESSPWDGYTLAQARIRDVANVLVLAIQGEDGRDYTFPPASFVLKGGMRLIVLGEPDSITRLKAALRETPS